MFIVKNLFHPRKSQSSDSPGDNFKMNNIFNILNIEKKDEIKSSENEDIKIKIIVKAHFRRKNITIT